LFIAEYLLAGEKTFENGHWGGDIERCAEKQVSAVGASANVVFIMLAYLLTYLLTWLLWPWARRSLALASNPSLLVCAMHRALFLWQLSLLLLTPRAG